MKSINFTIKHGTIEECIELSTQLPEFSDKHYAESDYTARLQNVPHLILVAYQNNQPIGFKVGYQRATDGTFYSWLGGVLPAYRRQGVANKLAEEQEMWAKSAGYNAITFKSRNYLKAMLIFALQNGFQITEVIPKDTIANNRIILRKELA